MTDGVSAEAVFKYNNEDLLDSPFNWVLGESGTRLVDGISYNDGSPLDTGGYQWELYHDSTLLTAGEFFIQ